VATPPPAIATRVSAAAGRVMSSASTNARAVTSVKATIT
jgi:hypothetical protein